MTLVVFHDFPSLKNGLTKFHDFPWLCRKNGHPGLMYRNDLWSSSHCRASCECTSGAGMTDSTWSNGTQQISSCLGHDSFIDRRFMNFTWISWFSSDRATMTPMYHSLSQTALTYCPRCNSWLMVIDSGLWCDWGCWWEMSIIRYWQNWRQRSCLKSLMMKLVKPKSGSCWLI